MLCRLMRRPLLLLALPVVAAVAVACGSEEIDVAKNSPEYDGAEIFHQRCAGCHSLDVDGAQGSAVKANKREYKDGPNFDQRKEDVRLRSSTRSATAASPPARCRRTSWSARRPRRSRRFVAENSGKQAKSPEAP